MKRTTRFPDKEFEWQQYRTAQKFSEFDILSARIAFNLGNTCNWLSYDSEALSYVTLAKNYFEKVSDSLGMANTLFSLGLTYQSKEEWEQSKSCLQQALVLYQSKNMFRTAQRVKHAYATLILRQTAPKEAVRELLKSAHVYTEEKDYSRAIYTYACIAAIHMGHHELEQTKLYLDMGMNLFEEEKARTDPRYVLLIRVFGEYFLKSQNYDSSIQYSFNAANMYGNMGLEMDMVECLKNVVETYKAMGNSDKALDVSVNGQSKFTKNGHVKSTTGEH